MKVFSVLFTCALFAGASLLASRLQAVHALPAGHAQSISPQASTDNNDSSNSQH